LKFQQEKDKYNRKHPDLTQDERITLVRRHPAFAEYWVKSSHNAADTNGKPSTKQNLGELMLRLWNYEWFIEKEVEPERCWLFEK
jgi:hypothetical protein